MTDHKTGKRERLMKLRMSLLIFGLISGSLVFLTERVLSQNMTVRAQQNVTDKRDGQHDFDWAVGSWKIHLKQLARPLSGATEWVEFDGTVVCRKVWGGRAELEEFNVDSPTNHKHIQGLALRLYNPESHQWSIYWANAAKGTLDLPPVAGQFSGGRGEFYDTEVYEGKAIFTRFVWTGVTGNSPHFEQSYSADGGKTWETNWITDQTRDEP